MRPPPHPCAVPSLSLACSSLPFPALALAPCSFPGTKAGPLPPFPIFSPSKVCRNARQTDTDADTDTGPGRPEHASRSMTHDPHLCSPPQTYQGSLHSTPLQVLSASNTHTHTICINLLHLAIFNTRTFAHTRAICTQRPEPASTTDRLLFQANRLTQLKQHTNASKRVLSITQVLLPPPMRPNL